MTITGTRRFGSSQEAKAEAEKIVEGMQTSLKGKGLIDIAIKTYAANSPPRLVFGWVIVANLEEQKSGA